ncbi:MAG: hypothetical protein LBQ52_08000 [Helicobacteraceae bacterium]|nr:hypothetical protein [Helicobacteraceae bacterium]
MKRTIFCLLALFAFSGCDEGGRYNDERSGTSIEVIDRVRINGIARSRIKISLGENQSGYVSVLSGLETLLSPQYVTKEQIDVYEKHIVCDLTRLSYSSANIRCGWTQKNRFGYWDGVLGGDDSQTRWQNVSLSAAVQIDVKISDRKEGNFWLYIDGSGYLY